MGVLNHSTNGKFHINLLNQSGLAKYISKYCKTIPIKAKAVKPKDFFSLKKRKFMPEIQSILTQNATQDKNIIQTQQQKYIKVFLLMYFGYLNELVVKKLKEFYGYIGSQKVGFLFSMEKKLMNDIIGTKKNLREILLASSFIPKFSESRKVRMTTQGEEVLPLLLQRLNLDLPLKSYFVLSQLHATYLQLTLKQVVKIASEEEEDAAITIQDEIVPIENIYNVLPKNIWKHMISNKNVMSNCSLHCKGYMSLENYTEFKSKINAYVHEKVKKKLWVFILVMYYFYSFPPLFQLNLIWIKTK